MTNADANAIATYIDNCPFEEKSDPWKDLAERAGVVKEYRDKENLDFDTQTIQKHVTAVSTIKTHKSVVKEKHTPKQQQQRYEWCILMLELRPHGQQWRCVLWCDELHWMTGPKYQKGVKRRSGDPAQYDPRNIQYKKDHKPDPDTQDHFHIYTVLGYNFA
ncbi:hypothetical protein EJ02DRAFT_466299 [Clathrospora elynae]|uniref:Uncharacterized protein n=1 Tax=Clathrospora elynae TaxID=706981 RepID=A0A6A5ST12_9PLEO|nr:hypothetical protein EJ02DRAFT_466299 [Clathrospora elynae]